MTMFSEKMLKELQESIDLRKVCDAVNMTEVGDVPTFACPFCTEYSFVLNSQDKPTHFYCFGCKKSGDAIELLTEGWNQTFNDAVNFLSIMFNVEVKKINDTEKDKPIKKNTPAYVIPLIYDLIKDSPSCIEERVNYAKIAALLTKIEKNKEES